MGVDGSDHSRDAIDWAVGNAGPGDTVVLLTGWRPVIPPAEMGVAYVDDDAPLRSMLEGETDRVRPLAAAAGASVESRFVPVDPRIALVDEPADLVVIGSRGHNRLVGLLLGSTADYVSRHARVPVVIVPRHHQ